MAAAAIPATVCIPPSRPWQHLRLPGLFPL